MTTRGLSWLVAVALAGIWPATGVAKAERLAFVSSEADGKVVVVDLETEKVTGTLPVGKVPHAMAIGLGGAIFVSNRGSKELTVIDSRTASVVATIPLPATSFQLAASPGGKLLAVAYKDALELSIVDVSTRAIVSTVTLGKPPAGDFKGAMIRHPYWSPDGKFVYVPDDVNKVVVKVDVARAQVAKVIDLGAVTHYLLPSPDGKLLYAVNEKRGGGTSVTLIDAATDAIVQDLPVALAPDETALGHHGAFTRDGRHFLFCNEGGHHVSVLDVGKREWVKTIETGQGPGHAALSPDGKLFFVVHHHDRVVTVIDAAKLEAVKSIKIGDRGEQSHAAWFTPDGRFFYVVSGDGALVKIDVASGEVASRIGVGPRSFFFVVKDGEDFPLTE